MLREQGVCKTASVLFKSLRLSPTGPRKKVIPEPRTGKRSIPKTQSICIRWWKQDFAGPSRVSEGGAGWWRVNAPPRTLNRALDRERGEL